MATLTENLKKELNGSFTISGEQIAFYRKNNYIKLKHVLSKEALDYYRQAIWDKTLELNTNTLPLEKRDTYSKAFIQVHNLWCHSEVVREFVFSRKLAEIAAALMEVETVRLYHDQSLFKESKGGLTPWHVDQQYWPLATDRTITAWIPLLPISLDMGPLSFAAGSHRETAYRGLAISSESEEIIGKAMADYDLDQSAYDLGEVSFHSGWLYHHAGRNTSGKMRAIMTIIYMDGDMRLKEPENPNQRNDWEAFCPGVKIGEVCDSPLNPLLYP